MRHRKVVGSRIVCRDVSVYRHRVYNALSTWILLGVDLRQKCFVNYVKNVLPLILLVLALMKGMPCRERTCVSL